MMDMKPLWARQFLFLLILVNDQAFAFSARKVFFHHHHCKQSITSTHTKGGSANNVKEAQVETVTDSSCFMQQRKRREFLHGLCFGSIFPTMMMVIVPDKAVASSSSSSCSTLEDARSQLDLAVQASSVQAFQDAAEILNDGILDRESLEKAFDSCGGGTDSRDSNDNSNRNISLAAVTDFRKQLNQPTKLSTEDAMASMKYGTSARLAMDTFLEKNKLQ
mmetsp:Transcript_6275/g.8870  ORF Transcript_6275/g.8870 Transcript_6275/m.8870 type:complete len:220 (+) Transcript_6275:21-680(+)